MIPKDPIMLLSYINTQLRDIYPSLLELCKSLDLDENDIVETLIEVNYRYDSNQNRFI